MRIKEFFIWSLLFNSIVLCYTTILHGRTMRIYPITCNLLYTCRSAFDSLLYLLKCLFALNHWPLWVMVYTRSILGRTIDAVSTVLLRRFLCETLSEGNCIRMIRFVHDSVFGAETTPPTNQVGTTTINCAISFFVFTFSKKGADREADVGIYQKYTCLAYRRKLYERN